MELVYLWVEDYKNIKNQGFNFSSRFRCDYNPDTNELTVNENDDYIENFFGENINITAIVGKNGSGKSSVFEILSQILTKKDELRYFYILFDGNNNKIYTNDIFMKTEFQKEEYIPRKVANGKIENAKNRGAIAFGKYIEMYYLNISHLERDMLIKNDAIKFEDPLNYLGIYAKNDFERNDKNSIFPSFSEFNLDKFNFFLIYSIGYLLKDKKYSDFFFDIFKIKRPSKLKINFNKKELERIKISNTKINSSDTRVIDETVPSKINNILEFLKKNSVIDIGSDNYNKFFELASTCYSSQTHFKLTFKTDKNETIKFSSGELTVFFYLNKIDDMLLRIRKDEQKNIILLWDEIELYLHPMWQKKILKTILDFINIKLSECSLNIIINSHSPFLLSDIPKQNIIFLDKDENGNCKVVDGLNEKKETFGANIHTLLSDSFFMEGGLMGEFAKSKINEIIDFHKKVEEENKKEKPDFTLLKKEYEAKKDKFWQTQSIIGEEYLKQVVKNHLVDIENILLGFDEAKQEEVKRVESYLKSLKND